MRVNDVIGLIFLAALFSTIFAIGRRKRGWHAAKATVAREQCERWKRLTRRARRPR